ncbi:MAG: beta-ketoacyl synthase [Pirellulaceae bacterium]
MSESSPRRVVITGIGLISPLGNSPDELWQGLSEGRSGVSEIQGIDPSGLPTRFAAEARTFSGHIDNFGPLDPNQKKTIRKGLKVMCREIQMGVAAAQLALHHAGLKMGDYDVDRTGVVFGCDYIMTLPEEFAEGIRACTDGDGFHFGRWAEVGLRKVDPLWLLKYLPNMPACHVAIYNDMRGPNNSITLREASANLAVAEAFCTIARGSADRMLSGAAGSRVHPLRTLHIVLQEEIATAASAATPEIAADPARWSRPFDRDRRGLILGEGAGVLVLEELGSALRRGTRIWGEVVGYGSSTVADRDGVAHRGVALENAMVTALRSAGLSPQQVGHIHAHGLGTCSCDAEEAQALQRVFGDCSPAVPVTAAKGHFGNLGAAGGLVELIGSLLALDRQQLFGIRNYESADAACPLHAARTGMSPGDSFLNVNVSPVGQASAVVIRRYIA